MTKKPSVYIETSFVSYLTNRLSNDYLISAHQRVTRDWWERRRQLFELCISQVVSQEIREGDSQASSRRVQAVRDITELELTPKAVELAKDFVKKGALPSKAFNDALHVAIAAINGIDYILTWNCTHIANGEIIHVIMGICEEHEYKTPLIFTPLELMGDESHE